MEKFKIKTSEELENQLNKVESFFGQNIEPKSTREEMLSLSLDELKERYPKQYQSYLNVLQTEAQILNFPDIPEGSEPKIKVLPTGAREYAFKIIFPDGAHVIKPLESLAEKNSAEIASELGVGPRQFKTKEGYLHEEFIEGTLVSKLDEKKCTPEFMENLGQKFVQALNKLHEKNILVNDQILVDDFGKSHMIIDGNGEVRFIDFGASVDISNFPDITDEEVMSLMRTDPFMMFRMSNMLNSSEEEKKTEIKGYREHILSQFKTKEDIIQMKDTQLLNEGLHFLRNHLPNMQFFIKGIQNYI